MKNLVLIKKNRIIIAAKGNEVNPIEVEKNLQIDNSALLEIKSNYNVKYEIRKKNFYKANIAKEAIEKLGKGRWNIRIKYDGKAAQEVKIELVVYEHK